jgi:hypothetical protein
MMALETVLNSIGTVGDERTKPRPRLGAKVGKGDVGLLARTKGLVVLRRVATFGGCFGEGLMMPKRKRLVDMIE